MREMKDSGIEWIDKIPRNWEVKKIKYISREVSQKKLMTNENLYPYLGLENVKSYSEELMKTDTVNDEGLQKFCKKGNVLFSKLRPYLAKVIICPFDTFSTSEFLELSPDQTTLTPKFLKYSMLNVSFLNIVNLSTYGAKMPRADAFFIKSMKICVPDVNQQHKIADFLDEKCAEIDALTSDIQTQIETLEEYKKSLIYRCISRGFSKDSELKETDSKIWSKIPSSWKLVDIKYLFNIVKRIAGKEGFDVLSVTQSGLKIKDITSGEGQLANDYSGYQFVYPGDFVMNHMDLLTGWVDLSKMFGVTSPDYRVFKLKDNQSHIDSYYKYVMQCCYLNRIFYQLGQGVANLGRWRLQTSSFNNFKIPVPPVHEQKMIADFLNCKCTEINMTISEKQQQLETLAEYKKSLIYEYVTGKKEVA